MYIHVILSVVISILGHGLALFLHISTVKVMVTSACKNYVAPNPSDPCWILHSDGGFYLPTHILKGLVYAMGH
jgi:hypothetical protein